VVRRGIDARVAPGNDAGVTGRDACAAPLGEDAAVEVAAELPLHVWRHWAVVVVSVAAVGEPGLEVSLDGV